MAATSRLRASTRSCCRCSPAKSCAFGSRSPSRSPPPVPSCPSSSRCITRASPRRSRATHVLECSPSSRWTILMTGAHGKAWRSRSRPSRHGFARGSNSHLSLPSSSARSGMSTRWSRSRWWRRGATSSSVNPTRRRWSRCSCRCLSPFWLSRRRPRCTIASGRESCCTWARSRRTSRPTTRRWPKW